MRKIFTLFLAQVFIVSLGLAQSDLSITDIRFSSDNSNQIPGGIQTTFSVTLLNNGPLTLATGDTTHISVVYGIEFHTMEYILTTDLDSGETMTLNFGESHRVTFDASIDTITVSASISCNQDPNSVNDLLAEEFYIQTSINNDWKSKGITIVSPSNLNGFDIDNGTNIPPPLTEINVELNNNGTVTYLQGSIIEYQIFINDDIRSLEGVIKDSDVEPGQSTVRVITNQAKLPAIPIDTAGAFQLCAKTMAASDNVSSNDASCLIFTMVDNYDPNDPINWPQGTDERALSNSDIYAADGSIVIKTTASDYSFSLFDLSGKLVMSDRFTRDTKVNVKSFNSGVYFIRLELDGQQPITEKIVLY
ncbi:MAG: T9SS type A sorting domain-containing protein [Flavobacteriales bacterium]